jgi:glycosyltransferase involved in cell wall biosynthesis
MNRQVLSADVVLVIGNRVADKRVLGGLSESVVVRHLGRPPGSRNPWYLFKLNRLARTFRPDIIHMHNASMISGLLVPTGTKVVLTAHNMKAAVSRAIYRYDRIFSISNAVRDSLQSGRWPVASTVVFNGIRFDAFAPKVWKQQSAPFRIVQVGRLLSETKGQDVLLRAMRIVQDHIGPGMVTVDFIGDGPDRDVLMQLARSLDVAECCRFLGALPREVTYEMLPRYDLLVQPSLHEGFGLTVVEGVAAGLPVLVSDLDGPREILDGGRYGYLFEPGQSPDCARQILKIISESGTSGFSGGIVANRQALRCRFDVEKTADTYLSEYEQLLGRFD